MFCRNSDASQDENLLPAAVDPLPPRTVLVLSPASTCWVVSRIWNSKSSTQVQFQNQKRTKTLQQRGPKRLPSGWIATSQLTSPSPSVAPTK